MRTAQIERNTNETQIQLTLNVDGRGQYHVDTGCGFLNHMLELFARHGSFDLEVTCQGDIQVDDHHTVEDIGIALGKAFSQALGDLRGVYRYGNFLLPMDEALVLCAVDLSGRGYLGWQMELPTEKVGTFDTELAEEFWIAFSRNCGATLHFQQMAGRNSHHILEAAFKGMGRALRQAVAIEPGRENEIPSTKGIL
ncbi:MAG: imidazoleglycerol-phosphate dehydratase HisB [Oscillospiraceae bacterium]|nr:imidazoleglycerol-phosphate dehydratase HisB [Oscillospiraceae bacterium]